MHQQTNSTVPQPPRTHKTPTYKIAAKWNNPRLSYGDLTVCDLDAVRHLVFHRKWILTIPRPLRTDIESSSALTERFMDFRRCSVSKQKRLKVEIDVKFRTF